LANEVPTHFEALDNDVWRRWLPAILRPSYYDELDAHRLLTRKAFDRVPQDAAQWTIKVLDRENKEGENLWVLSKLPDRWDNELREGLLRRAKQKGLKPQCTAQLLTALLEHQVGGALDLVRLQNPKKAPKTKPRRLASILAARLLMVHGENADWPRIWNLVKADAAWGRDMLEGFAYDYRRSPDGALKTLRESQIAALWEWMQLQYPVADDRDRSAGGEVTTRDAMADFRNHLVSYLADIGTQEGCKQLRELIQKYPEFKWFNRVLVRGQEQTRRNTWNPPAPRDVFSLAKNRDSRLVQSESQLQEVIIDALCVLQKKLSGERQLAQFLWDGDRPKPEEAISEWVAAELEDDLEQRGVVLGREVQIHRFDETDIYVTAVTRDERSGNMDTVKVIVEVKGCWHRDVKSAMEDQLLKRYLTNSDCKHGIYLVAWFPPDHWSNQDQRRKQVKFASRSDLELYVSEQARALSAYVSIQAVVLDFAIRTAAKKTKTTKPRL
jgi:hypothetical protein